MKIAGLHHKKQATKFFCGLCGFQLPLDKKYFFKLYQDAISLKDKVVVYLVHVGYTCPECGVQTEYYYKASTDSSEFFKEFNLYTDSRKGNSAKK